MTKKEASFERIIDRLFQKKNHNSRKKYQLKAAGQQENEKLLAFHFQMNCKNLWLELIFCQFLLIVTFPRRAEILSIAYD